MLGWAYVLKRGPCVSVGHVPGRPGYEHDGIDLNTYNLSEMLAEAALELQR